MEAHARAVARISAAARAFHARGEPYRISHGSTNSTRPRPRPDGGTGDGPPSSGSPLQARRHVIEIGDLRRVLSVDPVSRTALAEPNVAMDALVAATLAEGMVPPVVTEFPGITVGGAFAGTAGESSSFRHGWFDRTVAAVEMVMPDGEVVRVAGPRGAAVEGGATGGVGEGPSRLLQEWAAEGQGSRVLVGPDGGEHELFRAAAGALGTLSVTTLVEVKLQPAKRFVKATYHRRNSVAETIATVREETAREGNDYVDGILFSRDHGVVISGRMTDGDGTDITTGLPEKDVLPVRTFSRPSDPWFYLHVEMATKSSGSAGLKRVEELIPLPEYLFRYDRGGFWVGRSAFTYFGGFPGFSRATRWFLDDFLHTRMLYRALHASGQSSRYVVQDLALPYETAEAFVNYTAREFGIWPLWLCPLLASPPPTFHPHARLKVNERKTPTPMLNIGLWGFGPSDRTEFVRLNRDLEHRLRYEFCGMKWLYAHTYYTEPEFWDVYDKAPYTALRKKYGAENLPTVFDKVKRMEPETATAGKSSKDRVISSWPLGGLWGIWKAIQSREYLLHRKKPWKDSV